VAKVVLLRGVNVGGHRALRPSELAKQLGEYEVVNIGAAGTFVVRKPVSDAQLRQAFLARLPFECRIIICDDKPFLQLAASDYFAGQPSGPTFVHFVTVLSEPARLSLSLPVHLPGDTEWYVKVIACNDRFICGIYKRHLKTIRYLGEVDRLAGVPATTRNWNTITSVVKYLG
jgi:uncharacterized protein (DUF1697 family)